MNCIKKVTFCLFLFYPLLYIFTDVRYVTVNKVVYYASVNGGNDKLSSVYPH